MIKFGSIITFFTGLNSGKMFRVIDIKDDKLTLSYIWKGELIYDVSIDEVILWEDYV